MRPRFVIFVLVVALLIVALLLWRRPVHAPMVKQTTNAPITAASSSTPVAAPKPAPPPPLNQPLIVTHKVETPEQRRQGIESANAPIDFYGLVIDQNSNPIPGVTIKSGVRHWGMPDLNYQQAGSITIQLETTTGPDGRFELTGATGDGFGVGLYKDGYDAESEKNGFGTGKYSYDNPVIFKMWRTNIHEKLIAGNDGFKIVPDGRSYVINLTDDTISEMGTGDLKVWIQYTNHVVSGQLCNWSAGVDVINGGLLSEPQGNPMFEAPTSGYASAYRSDQQIRVGERGQTGERQFYLQLQNGKEYGQMTIDLLAPFNADIPGLVRLSYAINPSGSRILR
jgi:hypothetical protein